MSTSNISFKVQDLLDKINDIDQDIRFMSFNDLNAILTDPDNFEVFMTQTSLTTVVSNAIVAKLSDNISEVQNQAAKWYVVFFR